MQYNESSSDLFSEKLSRGALGVCIKNSDFQILFQNEACKKYCYSKKSDRCDSGCMSLFISNEVCKARSEGFQLFTDLMRKGKYFDVAILNNGSDYLTFVYPLGNKHLREMEFFADKGLSRREHEVIEKVVQGLSNSEILKELKISKATLKTHLNNIYKKLPPETRVGFRRRLI